MSTQNRQKQNILRYPEKRIQKDDDYIRFQVLKYIPPGIEGIQKNASFNLRSTDDAFANGTSTLLESIILPLPKSISDGQGASWGASSINSLEAMGASALNDLLKGKKTKDITKNLIESVGSELGDKKTRESLSTAAIALGIQNLTGSGDVNSLVSRATGRIINPNVEMLFDGVQLRGGFNFIFDLMPRNKDEGDTIKRIIRSFKKQMLPSKTSKANGVGGFFVKAPNVYRLEYMRGAKPHPFLNKFKICGLVSMSVDYSGSGQYASYHDATPVHMTMNLQFQELSPIYSDDYDKPEIKEGVGY